ncbi:MAG: MFS transporter [Alphaproteobacteria bacterium]|nr:MFS transporter [Alphaproteobacteria bacterium]
MTNGRSKSRGLIGAFSHRNFAIFAIGNFPSQCGVWAQRLAIGWLTWELTESGWWLGLMGFADLVPVVLLSPFAGYMADRFERITMARIIQFLNVSVTASLMITAYAGWLNIELLLLFAFITGMDHALFQPIRASLPPALVTREDLPAAIAFGGFTWNSARVVGPAIGAAILHFWGVNAVFLVNTILYFWFFAALWLVRVPPAPKHPASGLSIVGDIIAGYRYAASHPVIGPSLLILFGSSFLTRPLVELLPGFSSGIFGQGADGLAILTSAMGIGAVTAGITIAQRGRFDGLARVTTYAVLVGAIVLVVFTNTSHFEVAVVCMVFFGIQYSLVGTCIQSLVQAVAEETMRGRVMALYGLLWIGGAAIGSLVMGALSEVFGLSKPIAISGVVCLVVFMFAWRVKEPIEALIAKQQDRD